MEIHKLSNALMVTGTATFTGTATSVDVPAGSLGKVFHLGATAVGTAAPGGATSYRLSHELTSGGDWVSVPSTGKVTIERDIEDGATNDDLTIQYCLVGH